MRVGVRELRDSLSKHLAQVREGETVVVTDHGRPVARIVPVDHEDPLERLIAEGRVTPPATRKKRLPRRIQARGSVSDLVAEQRR